MAVRAIWLRRAAVAALFAAAGGLLASFGRAQPWWARQGVTMCEAPAQMALDGRLQFLGSCAGSGGFFKVTLHLGQQIGLLMTEEGSGPSGNQVVPVIPLPRSSRPSVVMSGPISPGQATGSYQAVHTGYAAPYSQARCLIRVISEVRSRAGLGHQGSGKEVAGWVPRDDRGGYRLRRRAEWTVLILTGVEAGRPGTPAGADPKPLTASSTAAGPRREQARASRLNAGPPAHVRRPGVRRPVVLLRAVP
jgi:hypothetical protein